MTFYPQSRITFKGEHRLHDRLNTLLVVNQSMVMACYYLIKGRATFAEGETASHQCRQLNIKVRLPIFGPLEAALGARYPDKISVTFEECVIEGPYNEWAAGLGRSGPIYYGLMSAAPHIAANTFVEFYEAFSDFIYDKYGKVKNWPAFWRFARVVRNSISHGGKVAIDNEKDEPVEWYGLRYSFANRGHPIIGVPFADLNVGDLIVLMFEMNDFLDAEGCPIELSASAERPR